MPNSPRGSRLELDRLARQIAPKYGETLRTMMERNAHQSAQMARAHFYAEAYETGRFSWDRIADFCGGRDGGNALRSARGYRALAQRKAAA